MILAMIIFPIKSSIYYGYLFNKISKKVFTHYFPYYRFGYEDFGWKGWNLCGHNPDNIGARGERDIASVFYPIMGIYSTNDAEYLEYQVQLMKLAGIDGVGIDVGVYWEDIAKSVRILCNLLKKYEMEAFLVFHDNARFLYSNQTDRFNDVAHSYYDLNGWLNVIKDVQIRIQQRPIIAIVSINTTIPEKGITYLGPYDIESWIASFEPIYRPIVVSNLFGDEFNTFIDGELEWVVPGNITSGDYNFVQEKRRELVGNVTEKFNNMAITFHISTVWPGYDDGNTLCFAGQRRYLTREVGATYRHSWEAIFNKSSPIVLIDSWNNWANGTQIEPSSSFGYSHLEQTKDNIEEFKGIKLKSKEITPKTAEYSYRFTTRNNQTAKAVSDGINELIKRGDYIAAEIESIYYAEELGIKDKEIFVSFSISLKYNIYAFLLIISLIIIL